MEKGGSKGFVVKYGLTVPGKRGTGSQKSGGGSSGKAERSNKKLPALPSAFLENEDDDSENVESEIARQAMKKRSQIEVESMHAAALQQDASVFDYDGVYDEMKNSQNKRVGDPNKPRESRYIGQLLEKAKIREKEQEIVRERLLIKEREKEDHVYGDKEKFVTRAYREKLAENQLWLMEEKKREAMEEANDVTKKKDLSDFYRNLLTKNVAFGGDVSTVVAKPSSSDAQTAAEADPLESQANPESKPKPDSEKVHARDQKQEPKESEKEEEEEPQRKQANEDEHSPRSEPEPKKRVSVSVPVAEDGSSQEPKSSNALHSSRKPDVQSARERYLARKKQKI